MNTRELVRRLELAGKGKGKGKGNSGTISEDGMKPANIQYKTTVPLIRQGEVLPSSPDIWIELKPFLLEKFVAHQTKLHEQWCERNPSACGPDEDISKLTPDQKLKYFLTDLLEGYYIPKNAIISIEQPMPKAVDYRVPSPRNHTRYFLTKNGEKYTGVIQTSKISVFIKNGILVKP